MASPPYSRTQVVLHWVIVLLVAAQYLLSGGIEALWDQRMSGALPNVATPTPHTITGMLILGLMIWRTGLRVRRGAVPLPNSEPALLRAAAQGTQFAFYALLIAMPLSGFAAWFLGATLPAEAHEIASKGMLALIALHILGAAAQALWFKSDVMGRMSPRVAILGYPQANR